VVLAALTMGLAFAHTLELPQKLDDDAATWTQLQHSLYRLDRYGHLYPESDAALRDRLDAIYSAGQRDQGAGVVELFRERSRPQRSPGTRRAPPALDR
jgi:hypothetical protein